MADMTDAFQCFIKLNGDNRPFTDSIIKGAGEKVSIFTNYI